MMRSEFIERTGFEPTFNEYQEIESQYMESDMDKDAWCKKWKRDGGIVKYANSRRQYIDELECSINKLRCEIDLITQSRDYNKNLADQYREETFHLKKAILELEHDRDTYRNKLQAIKDALNF